MRFGDPETQPVMLRLQSDLVDLVEAAIDGKLETTGAQWDPRPSLGVVMAAEHYPGAPRLGDAIAGLDVGQGHDHLPVQNGGGLALPQEHLFAGPRLDPFRALLLADGAGERGEAERTDPDVPDPKHRRGTP